MITKKDIFYNVNDMLYSLNEGTIKGTPVNSVFLGSPTLLSESIYNTLTESNLINENIDSNLKNIIIKQQIFEELGLTKSNSYLKFLFESLESLSKNSDNILLERGEAGAIGHVASAPLRRGEEGVPQASELFGSIGATAGIEAGRGALAALIKNGRVAANLTKDANRMQKAARIANTATKAGNASKSALALSKAPKWLQIVGKLFPKLLPKVAGLSAKAAKAVLIAGTMGFWAVVELILFIASKGGIKLITSNTKFGKWCVKGLLKFIDKHPNWVKGINVIWEMVFYGDWKEVVLRKGIEWGYITKEKAQELEVKSNLFGDKFANDFTGAEEGEEETANNTEETQNNSTISKYTRPEQKQSYKDAQIPQVPDANTMNNIYADIQSTGLVPKNFGNWLVILRNAVNQGKLPGWTLDKIEYYRKMINAAYAAKRQRVA